MVTRLKIWETWTLLLVDLLPSHYWLNQICMLPIWLPNNLLIQIVKVLHIYEILRLKFLRRLLKFIVDVTVLPWLELKVLIWLVILGETNITMVDLVWNRPILIELIGHWLLSLFLKVILVVYLTLVLRFPLLINLIISCCKLVITLYRLLLIALTLLVNWMVLLCTIIKILLIPIIVLGILNVIHVIMVFSSPHFLMLCLTFYIIIGILVVVVVSARRVIILFVLLCWLKCFNISGKFWRLFICALCNIFKLIILALVIRSNTLFYIVF